MMDEKQISLSILAVVALVAVVSLAFLFRGLPVGAIAIKEEGVKQTSPGHKSVEPLILQYQNMVDAVQRDVGAAKKISAEWDMLINKRKSGDSSIKDQDLQRAEQASSQNLDTLQRHVAALKAFIDAHVQELTAAGVDTQKVKRSLNDGVAQAAENHNSSRRNKTY